MRRLVLEAPGRLRVQVVPQPVPSRGEVRVVVAAAGVCGSDLHGYRGDNDRRPPGTVMGHELSGRVDMVGAGVDPGLVGRSVVVNPLLSCGACSACSLGRDNLCPAKRLLGCTVELPGGFAEAVVVPAGSVLPWCTDLPLGWGAFVEPLAVGLHAAERADVAGARVLVVGSGAIGVAAALSARRLGAASVTVHEVNPTRLDLLDDLRLVAVAEPPVRATFDVVLECVAAEDSLALALRAVVPGGLVVLVGVGRAVEPVAVADLVHGERTLRGSAQYSREVFQRAASWLGEGSIDCDRLLSPPVPLEQAVAAFALWAQTGVRHGLRAVLSPGSGGC